MTGDEVRHVLEAMVPQGEIACLCAPFGVIERQRTLKRGMFVRALVLSAGTPGGADPADVLRSSLEGEVPPVARPTMGIWSKDDMALVEENMTGSAAHVTAEWRYERIDGAGHWIPLEAPDELTALLLDFLPAPG